MLTGPSYRLHLIEKYSCGPSIYRFLKTLKEKILLIQTVEFIDEKIYINAPTLAWGDVKPKTFKVTKVKFLLDTFPEN